MVLAFVPFISKLRKAKVYFNVSEYDDNKWARDLGFVFHKIECRDKDFGELHEYVYVGKQMETTTLELEDVTVRLATLDDIETVLRFIGTLQYLKDGNEGMLRIEKRLIERGDYWLITNKTNGNVIGMHGCRLQEGGLYDYRCIIPEKDSEFVDKMILSFVPFISKLRNENVFLNVWMEDWKDVQRARQLGFVYNRCVANDRERGELHEYIFTRKD